MVARTLHTPTDQCTWESVAEEESALCRHGTAVSSPCAPLCAIGAYIPASEQGQGGVACSMVPGRATATGGSRNSTDAHQLMHSSSAGSASNPQHHTGVRSGGRSGVGQPKSKAKARA